MSVTEAVTETMDWLSGIGDPAFVAASYAEVLRELARQTGAFTATFPVSGVVGLSTYTVPAQAVHLDHVVWGTAELDPDEALWLEMVDPSWPMVSGMPQLWLEDRVSQNVFQVYPVPLESSAVLVMARVVPDLSQVPAWVDGVLALSMAAREALRLGETQDAPLAQALMTVAAGLTALLFPDPEAPWPPSTS